MMRPMSGTGCKLPYIKQAALFLMVIACIVSRAAFAGPVAEAVNAHTTSEKTAHQIWFVNVLWEDNLLPALMMMANQLSAVATQQTMILGTFLDAKNQMETQRSLQTVRAKAHKDYQTSTGMCEFGSGIKSLAASERKAEFAAHVMSQHSQDRQMGNANTAAAGGPDADKESRLKQYREVFCDPSDNNNGLGALCAHDGKIGGDKRERVNKDIDYTRTIEFPWTLDMDFTDTKLTDHEEEVLALASNLYGEDVFKRPPAASIQPKSGKGLTAEQANLMDARALMAKRGVAEASFNAITSMKGAGTAGSREFLKAILKDLGVSKDEELNRLLGDTAPSYYAQMEVLTKKIYQSPDFYTNLYDTPANVERKEVAMQAIGLMQKFDLFKSYLRTEASLSVLLETAVQDLQDDVDNRFHSQPSK